MGETSKGTRLRGCEDVLQRPPDTGPVIIGERFMRAPSANGARERCVFTSSNRASSASLVHSHVTRQADFSPHRLSQTTPTRNPSRQEFGTIFEMHGVTVIPLATPNEAVLLENLDHLPRDAVPMRGLAAHRPTPAPIIRPLGIDIDGDAVGMRALSRGAGDGAAMITSSPSRPSR
jgi:hypothetical protein